MDEMNNIIFEIISIREQLVCLQQLAIDNSLDVIVLEDFLTLPIGSLITISNRLNELNEEE